MLIQCFRLEFCFWINYIKIGHDYFEIWQLVTIVRKILSACQEILSLKICRNNCHLPPRGKLNERFVANFSEFNVTSSERKISLLTSPEKLNLWPLWNSPLSPTSKCSRIANELREEHRRKFVRGNFVRHGYAFEIVRAHGRTYDLYRHEIDCIYIEIVVRRGWPNETGQRNITKIERPVDINCVKCGS